MLNNENTKWGQINDGSGMLMSLIILYIGLKHKHHILSLSVQEW